MAILLLFCYPTVVGRRRPLPPLFWSFAGRRHGPKAGGLRRRDTEGVDEVGNGEGGMKKELIPFEVD